MSIVSCASCGMQFNAAGYDPGVQFQCTQCGAMVTVAAKGGKAAPGGRPGAKRATGMQKRGPAPAGARAARGGPAQQQGQEQPAYGQPYTSKKSNAGLFVALGVGVVVVGIIIAVVVMGSKPSPQENQKAASDKAFEEQKAAAAKRDAEQTAKNDALKRTLNAAMDRGGSIESALRGSDKAALEGMFDWTSYAAYLSDLAAKDPKFLASGPLFSSGQWVMDGPTPKWEGKAVHGPESLKTAVMTYIENHLFGSPEVKFEKGRSETLEGGFANHKVNGVDYIGKKIFIEVRGAGKTKEFWVGAPLGEDTVKILNFRDPSALNTLQQVYAKANRKPVDDRDPHRDDRDIPGKVEPRDPDWVEDPPANEELPAMAKTGAQPKDPALVNVVNALKDGNKLKPAQKTTITTGKSDDKKATLGALIDALIEAHNSGKRREKGTISHALFEVWGNFARDKGYKESDVTYDIEGRSQSDGDEVIRRWIKVYNDYK